MEIVGVHGSEIIGVSAKGLLDKVCSRTALIALLGADNVSKLASRVSGRVAPGHCERCSALSAARREVKLAFDGTGVLVASDKGLRSFLAAGCHKWALPFARGEFIGALAVADKAVGLWVALVVPPWGTDLAAAATLAPLLLSPAGLLVAAVARAGGSVALHIVVGWLLGSEAGQGRGCGGREGNGENSAWKMHLELLGVGVAGRTGSQISTIVSRTSEKRMILVNR